MSGGWQDEKGRDLPPNWFSEVVPAVKRAAATAKWPKGQCQWVLPSGNRCPRQGVDVDHKFDRNDHRPEKCQLLCEHHHDKKTAREGHTGWARKKDVSKGRRRDEHPGKRLR
jgi:5-methylcytosine-specific restriction protein A